MKTNIANSLNSLTHLFFPRLCEGCGSDLLGSGQLLCLRCNEQLPLTNFHLHANNPVEKIFWGRLPLTTAMSFAYFTKDSLLQHLLHKFKYNGNKEIGLFFGRKMGENFLNSNRYNDIDGIIPLPMYVEKEKKRGYNQATVLCEGISEKMKVPIYRNVIIRSGATETQTHKNRIQRWQNIEGNFALVNKISLQNKHVVLVDDVVTTGATLEACGKELLLIDSLRLSIATLAYTCQ